MGLPNGELKVIEAGYLTNVKWCCNAMLKKWLESSCKLLQAHEKVCDENERKYIVETRKKQSTLTYVLDGRKHTYV